MHSCFQDATGCQPIDTKRQMDRLSHFIFQEAIGEKHIVNKREIIEVQGNIFLRGDGQSRGRPGTLNRETQKYKD